jgi:hypothetical protein
MTTILEYGPQPRSGVSAPVALHGPATLMVGVAHQGDVGAEIDVVVEDAGGNALHARRLTSASPLAVRGDAYPFAPTFAVSINAPGAVRVRWACREVAGRPRHAHPPTPVLGVIART